jgi:hypothetical protein
VRAGPSPRMSTRAEPSPPLLTLVFNGEPVLKGSACRTRATESGLPLSTSARSSTVTGARGVRAGAGIRDPVTITSSSPAPDSGLRSDARAPLVASDTIEKLAPNSASVRPVSEGDARVEPGARLRRGARVVFVAKYRPLLLCNDVQGVCDCEVGLLPSSMRSDSVG